MNINESLKSTLITPKAGQPAPVATTPAFKGTISIHPKKFGFIETDDGVSYFIPQGLASRHVKGDIVSFDAEPMPDSDKMMVKNVSLILRPETYWMGTVIKNEDGTLGFTPDDTLLVGIELQKRKVAFNEGDVVQIKIKESTKSYRTIRCDVVANLGNDRRAKRFNEIYALTKERIPTEFGATVIKNSEEVSIFRAPSSYKNLEHVAFVTIDGESTRDFDDAVFAEVVGGVTNLKVAVADVSHYVTPDSPLDLEAKLRGTSVYLPQKVVPMFPEILSNGMCSLVPNESRLALVCDMDVSFSGEITRYSMYPAVIKSHARLTYTEVSSWLDADGDGAPEDLMKVINALNFVHKNLREKRAELGFIEIDRKEPKLIKDDDGEPLNITWVPCLSAHLIVEDCMLAANKCAAAYLISNNKGAIFRHHAAPSGESWEESYRWFKSKGIEVPELPTLKDFSDLQLKFKNTDLESLVDERLRRALDPAVYDNEQSSHFSLGFEAYTHFTSPIRRYPDLMVHRAIHAILANKEVALENDKELAEYCGMVSKRAARAERFVWTRLKLKFISSQKDSLFNAKIVTSSASGCKASVLDWDLAGWIDREILESVGYTWDRELKLWTKEGSEDSVDCLLDLGQRVSVKILDLTDEDMTLILS